LKLFTTNKSSSSRPTPKSVEDNALLMCHNRLLFVMGVMCFIFGILIFRLFDISLSSNEDVQITNRNANSNNEFLFQRASIEDRNGSIIAVNLATASLFVNPSKVVESKQAAEKLCRIFENSKCSEIREKITSDKTFHWLKRHLTPIEQQHINDLGLAGINFMKDEKRVYPHGNLFAHVVGYVDVDGNGLSGIERYFDERLKNNNEPVKLAVDIRIQQILRDEILEQAIAHSAIGGSGIVMDVNTGEIIAMTSLPDFDPHNVGLAGERARFNQVTLGAYELGSTFKILTLAMGLDGKHIGINDAFNTDEVIKIGNKQIQNYRGKGGIMATPEVLMYSSNIGSAQIGMKVGSRKQREYLSELGMLSQVKVELPERAYPLYPSSKLWTQASTITISYGHGIAVTPLHVARAIAAVVNGGYMVDPTLLKVTDQSKVERRQILSASTSETMRKLLRMVVVEGYGKKANAKGYIVGGKTGTAEKVSGRGYSKTANIASFIGAFPIHDPKYVVVVLIDEALPNAQNAGFTTGGMLAAPVAGSVISKIAPILGVTPRADDDKEVLEKLSINYQPRNPMTLKKSQ
jgi:cell division protein FtsI (penicillin-binding protein 3)